MSIFDDSTINSRDLLKSIFDDSTINSRFPSLFTYKTDYYANTEYINDLPEKYEIILALPGFEKKNVSVSMSGNKLIVRAKDNQFECFDDFEKIYDIPLDLTDSEESEIRYVNGVLQIVFKKVSKETKLKIGD